MKIYKRSTKLQSFPKSKIIIESVSKKTYKIQQYVQTILYG